MRSRRGSAILLVLAGAAAIAFAATGALAAVVEMRRHEVAERAILNAELAAEAAMARRLAAWEVREALGLLPPWLEDTHAPAGSLAFSHVQRAAPGLWLLHGVGERQSAAGNALARRSRTVLLRARPPNLPLTAPLTVNGTLELGTGVVVTAHDDAPPGWACHEPPEPATAAVALLPGATVLPGSLTPVTDVDHSVATDLAGALGFGAPAAGVLPIEPAVQQGDLTGPHIHHPPAVTCDLGAPGTPLPPLGWGDSARPSACERYHPFVRVAGNLVGPTGSGQGVLLIDGDLTVTGSFTWAGLLVVRGRLTVTGAGFDVTGALVLLGDDHHQLDGATTIAWSSCALRSAMVASAVVTPVTGSPWSTLR